MVKIPSKLILGIALSASLFAAGCASVPMAPPEADSRAKTFAPPASGTSNLYVYRNETMGSAIKMPLLLDGAAIGDTGPHTDVLKQVPAGKHTVVSKTENDASLDVDLVAGKNYFVWQGVTHNFLSFTYHSRLKLVDETTGQEGVAECELVATAE